MADFSSYKHIVVLTGAGISASAGLRTYRGPDGLWNDPEVAVLNDAFAMAKRRDEVAGMFWKFRRAIAATQPTVAHRALATFEDKLPAGATLTIITQNIDGLHQAAGSRRVCEYHGSLSRWRCDVCKGELTPPPDPETPPVHCSETMRPSVVAFGEMIPVDAERTAKVALRDCDLFVAIGTSGTVSPASSFVRWAALNGAMRVLMNLEIFDGARSEFTYCYDGKADDLVPQFFR